jgi:hypothetical protein
MGIEMALSVICPACGKSLRMPETAAGRSVTCPACQKRFSITIAEKTSEPVRPLPEWLPVPSSNPIENNLPSSISIPKTRPKYSGLGIASFLIGLLVGALYVIVVFVFAVGMAKPSHRSNDFGPSQNDIQNTALAGGFSLMCLGCMSLPICIVGAGLGLVGLIAHRDQNNLFSWIGLFINGVVVLGVVGLYVLARLST